MVTKNLLKDCYSVIQSILKKLKENSPLNFNLVRNAACLVPLNIIQKKNISVSKFGKLVTSLYECKHINAEEADQSKDQFESFVDSEAKKSAEEFSKYDMVNDHLDKFLGQWFFRNEKYTSLWKVMIFIFSLSHGQAQIKRGFKINADLLVENLTSPSIVAQRRPYDHLSVTKSSPHGFEIKDKLHVSCINAFCKYKENLKEIKNAEKANMMKKKLMLF